MMLVLSLVMVMAGLALAGDDVDRPQGPEGVPAGSGYSVVWSRVAAGGALAEAGSYQLHGTVGQHELQFEPVPAGSSFELRAGFWMVVRQSEPAIIDLIFRDRFRAAD